MRDKLTRIISSPAFIALTGIVLAACAFGVAFSAANSRETIKAATICPIEHCVELTHIGAQPNELSVQVGSIVQFNSADGKPHSLSLGNGGEEHDHTGKFSSGTFKSYEAWKVEFKEPGTYHFHDHLNPKTTILIVVYKSGEHKIQ